MSSQDSASSSSSDLTFNIYGYNPSLPAAIIFIVLFSLISLIQAGYVVRSRIWWLSVLCIGGLGQVIGWSGRLWSAKNVYSLNAFLIQQCCLILAPCFYSATVYGVLGMLIRAIDPNVQYSLLKPSLYLWIFCLADLLAIVVQAVGGAMAALALQDDKESSTGTNIMVAGIAIQLAAMIVFCCLGLHFYYRAKKDPAHRAKKNVAKGRIGLLTFGLTWASVWILVRCIYRVVELAQGWTGYLITHQPFFWGLDTIPMVLCQGVFLFTFPSFCLPDHSTLSTSHDLKVDEKEAAIAESV
ncbi:RTA1 domain protein [Leucosporidium creatinivorum]|uniref:RTA1 domain protein n=1 Tax=Leucosporidium creatinivorum TaxID=106004 RepID=A0A1Y2E6N3_9BASI|nr:RTA1 domain protein [Leucosporidium creatinivorum]